MNSQTLNVNILKFNNCECIYEYIKFYLKDFCHISLCVRYHFQEYCIHLDAGASKSGIKIPLSIKHSPRNKQTISIEKQFNTPMAEWNGALSLDTVLVYTCQDHVVTGEEYVFLIKMYINSEKYEGGFIQLKFQTRILRKKNAKANITRSYWLGWDWD